MGRFYYADSEQQPLNISTRSKTHLLFLDLALQGRDLDLHLLYLVLRQDLDAMTGVGVVQGLKGQVCQGDVPLALVLLMASVHQERMEGSRQNGDQMEKQIKMKQIKAPNIPHTQCSSDRVLFRRFFGANPDNESISVSVHADTNLSLW